MLSDENVMRKMQERNETPVSTDELRDMSQRIGAFAYCECSARTQKGMQEVFKRTCEAGLKYQGVIKPDKNDAAATGRPDNKNQQHQKQRSGDGGCCVLQ